MPGRTPREAVKAYIETIREDFACVDRQAFVHCPSLSKLGQRGTWIAGGAEGIDVLTRSGEVATITAKQEFEIVKCTENQENRFRVSTRLYQYELLVGGDFRFAYHWHPTGNSDVSVTHSHHLPDRKLHHYCDRHRLEDFLKTCIREYQVQPDDENAIDVLEVNGAMHLLHRTWHGSQPATP